MSKQENPSVDLDKVSLDVEVQRCVDSLNYVLRHRGLNDAKKLLQSMQISLEKSGFDTQSPLTTPYLNTITPEEQPEYPGDLKLERKIRSLVRWNAMAMVVQANVNSNVGGHISTFASCANLYEVGYNHFFRGNGEGHLADQIFFQGHASPGNYARSYLEGRLSETLMHNFRRELAPEGGLSSYPHPFLMPDYWQFPTVSMGLGPLLAIYQARFNRYMIARGFLKKEDECHVWCFGGDGETDEPETLGALSLAARESLDNLIFVVNCNLQRLDGPVRGNGKIIQDLEGVYRGAGWNVIKVVWGSNWDAFFKSKYRDLLLQRLDECVDGDFQKYTVSSGAYIRKNFFGKYPELLEMVAHMTDAEIKELTRGGHDPLKVYAAYKAATEHKGQPTVILAKTVKGYGLGEAGEGKNISHQQKKLNEKELREFKARFDIPIDDDVIADMPFYKPAKSAPEMKYLHERRKALNGYLPERKVDYPRVDAPDSSYYEEFYAASDKPMSTTMSFVRILMKLLRHPGLGKQVVPIIPDEGRTFGMEALFRQIGIYSSKGQLYEPVDSESLLYYKEATDGQMFEEGINEAGSMSTFIASGTSYATHGVPMIPFYIYYSMFGFQRVGDLMWLAGDIGARGFILGGTAGRTTLNGEGLQHQDGHNHLCMTAIPNCMAYDPAFRFELAVIIEEGIRRMYVDNESIYYYVTVCNENYDMLEMPKNAKEGILKGLYKLKVGHKKKSDGHIFGSGTIMLSALKAQEILKDQFNISVDVWSATSYKQLREDALQAQRWNMLNPDKKPQESYLETILKDEQGVFVAVSDNMKVLSDQIYQWVPGGLFSLGTDGYGRSETRENLRRFFEVDAECTVIGVLYQLSQKGKIPVETVKKAIKDLGVDPKKVHPEVF